MSFNPEILYSVIPPVYALLSAVFSKGEDWFFEKQATRFCRDKNLDLRMVDAFSLIAKSSVALRNYIISLFSGLLSIIIAFHRWPEKLRYFGVLLVIASFLIFFNRWIWRIFSLEPYEIAEKKVPKRKPKFGEFAFHNYIYAELFTRQQICFNIFLIIIILIGQLL